MIKKKYIIKGDRYKIARGNGEGTIYKRKDGRWCGAVKHGRLDNNGGLSARTVKYIYQTLHAALDNFLVDFRVGGLTLKV